MSTGAHLWSDDGARHQDETEMMEQQPAAAAAGGIPLNANGSYGRLIRLCLLVDCILTIMIPYSWSCVSEPITIVVRETSGKECFFKVKQTTAMRKVFGVFATRKGVDRSLLIFRLEDGTEIPDHETPRGIGLGNDGRINALSLREWIHELDASDRQLHDHLQKQHDCLQEQHDCLQEQHAHLQEQLDRLQEMFIAVSFKRDAGDSNENENDAKHQRSE
jgi:hypothetical protein